MLGEENTLEAIQLDPHTPALCVWCMTYIYGVEGPVGIPDLGEIEAARPTSAST